jgi:hypothetical protein
MTLALQLLENSNDSREKLRFNFHSLSVSELLEYGRSYLSRLWPRQETFLSTRFRQIAEGGWIKNCGCISLWLSSTHMTKHKIFKVLCFPAAP